MAKNENITITQVPSKRNIVYRILIPSKRLEVEVVFYKKAVQKILKDPLFNFITKKLPKYVNLDDSDLFLNVYVKKSNHSAIGVEYSYKYNSITFRIYDLSSDTVIDYAFKIKIFYNSLSKGCFQKKNSEKIIKNLEKISRLLYPYFIRYDLDNECTEEEFFAGLLQKWYTKKFLRFFWAILPILIVWPFYIFLLYF